MPCVIVNNDLNELLLLEMLHSAKLSCCFSASVVGSNNLKQ